MAADTLITPAPRGVSRGSGLKSQAPAEQLRCSIIMPVYYGGAPFAQCFKQALAALRKDDELIVVAGGEGDGTWRVAENSKARIVHAGRNVGPAMARNLGASVASGDFFLFIDADVAVPPDCIRQCAELFATEPDLGAIIGSYDDEPGQKNFVSQYKNLFHHYVHQNGRPDASTFWGACGAIRREAFFDAGGFDHTYPLPSIEDIEFGYRLRNKSYRIRLLHSLQVTHWKRWDAGTLLRSDAFDRAAPWIELILEQKQTGCAVHADLNLSRPYRISLIASLLFLISGIGAVFFRPSLFVAAAAALLFVAVNLPLLRFFRRRRGLVFCLRSIGWRFLYDLCSAVGVIVGVAHYIGRRDSEAGSLAPAVTDQLREVPTGVQHLPETK